MSKYRVPTISFLLCTRNRAETARKCIFHLLSSGRPDIEVIVRDNNSTDNTLELLRKINDPRLKIHASPENQGTFSFFEISKLASGKIVTWISDEDDFQFEHLDYICEKFEDSSCSVMFGSIVVGRSASRVIFPEKIIRDSVRANFIALSFSGCGGLFVRNSQLFHANALGAKNEDEGYMLWNYYPVGFFAIRCVSSVLFTTSRVVVRQSRFASTTNNWNARPRFNNRLPHYYPESVFDRLSSSIVNIFFKNISLAKKLKLMIMLIRGFQKHGTSYANCNFIKLLQENYSEGVVKSYTDHLKKTKINQKYFKTLLFLKDIIRLPLKIYSTSRQWKQMRGS